MLISPQTFAKAAPVAAWPSGVRFGDIVQFRALCDDGTFADALPCLVLDATHRADRARLLLAPGQPVSAARDRAYEIGVRAPSQLIEAGLAGPTVFLGASRISVSSTHAGFVPDAGTGSPVIGRLSGPAFDRMNAVRARIQAEADIAAYYRDRTPVQRDEDRRITEMILARIGRAEPTAA